MAINFLTGLNVDGNIDLNSNQLKEVRIDNLTSAPTGSLGRIYYDTTTTKLRLYDGAWVDLTTGADGNTTYTIDVPTGTTSINLKGNDGTDDPIALLGSGLIAVTRTDASTLTFSTTATNNVGTVTDVDPGTGIVITGTSTVKPTVSINYAGADNAILAATAADAVGADSMWFSDATDSTIKRALISDLPGFGKDGTVTEVDSGAGLITSPVAGITATGSIAIDYAGADNLILAAADGTSVTVVAADKILVSDADDSNAKYVNISQITAAIGGGTVQTVSGASSVNGLTLTSDDDTVDPILTLAGTLLATSGGTGQTAYTVGDILYASSTTALAKLGIGSTGQVLKVASGVPAWAADANAGGTVTSINLSGNAGTGTAITGSGIFKLIGSGSISTRMVGDTLTISTSATTNVGTVTSVTAGAGLGISAGSTSVNPTLAVGQGDGITVDATSVAVDGTVVRTSGVQTIAGVKTFSDQVVVPLTPTNDNNIASKAYVLSQIGGVGGFRGGYNASTNSPALSGGSNVAMALGDFFVVDVAGNNGGYFDTLEPGDFVFADAAIAVDSSPAVSAYTVVIADQNIAGAGTTDGGTIKGVAGFQSATFEATSNGFITVKTGGISDAQLASTFNKIIGIDTDIDTSGVQVVDQIRLTDGVVQTLSKRTLPTSLTTSVGVIALATTAEVRAGVVANKAVTPATLAGSQSERGYTVNFPAGAATTFTIAGGTHKLGSGPLIVQIYDRAKGTQYFMDTEVDPSTGDIELNWRTSVAANTYTVAVLKVS